MIFFVFLLRILDICSYFIFLVLIGYIFELYSLFSDSDSESSSSYESDVPH